MRISLRSKLLAAFGVGLALILTVGLFSLARLSSDNHQLSRLAERVVPSTRTVGDINALMNKYRKDQLHYIIALPADRPSVNGIDGDLDGDLTLMHQLLRSYRAQGLVLDSQDRALYDAFSTDFFRYVAITAPFHALADQGRALQAGTVVGDGAGDAEYNVLKSLITAWSGHKVSTANAAASASRSSYQVGQLLILLLLGFAVAVALIVAITFAHKVTRAVRAIGHAAKAISEGEIVERVPVRSRDELGEMADDFDSMVEYLRSTVGIAETIAHGDLDVEVTPRGPRDALGNALRLMTVSLRRLVAENARLLAASREEAHSDALTGLGNRRALMRDLGTQIDRLGDGEQLMLALFDLDGFKQYNDTFGHPAGDALLVRLGERLRVRVDGCGTAYRMGGDEFCVLARTDPTKGAELAEAACEALSERGEAFTIGCSFGATHLPSEASTAENAMRVADQRMYEHKTGRASASRQSTDVLLKVLSERNPGLDEHIMGVTDLAVSVAERLGLPEHEIKRVGSAAELHDIGKLAIPDSILNKPGPLDDDEWAFMRTHTVIGERIVLAAPCLAPAAELVRWSHERHDGSGYPDQIEGDSIPIGASIICACDAFDAMVSERPYSQARTLDAAIEELRRCSGAQFRPDVVAALCDELHERRTAPAARTAA